MKYRAVLSQSHRLERAALILLTDWGDSFFCVAWLFEGCLRGDRPGLPLLQNTCSLRNTCKYLVQGCSKGGTARSGVSWG